jgi:hypothetical protein
MLSITNKELKACLDKASEMAEQYKLYVIAGDGFPRSMESFVDICTDYLAHRISIYTLDPMPTEISDLVRAICISKDDGSYEIHLQADLNTCWQRFVLCKELFHVLLDAPEYRSMEMYKHLEEILLPSPEGPLSIYLPGTSEWMAEIAAMQFLLPYSERLQLVSPKVVPINFLDLAKFYRIPQVLVEQYLSKPWMDFVGPFSR